jgi:hypothetical protein
MQSAFLTQSMPGGKDAEQSFESCKEDLVVSLKAFVTPPSSPIRPRLSDVFTARVPDIPAACAVTGNSWPSTD